MLQEEDINARFISNFNSCSKIIQKSYYEYLEGIYQVWHYSKYVRQRQPRLQCEEDLATQKGLSWPDQCPEAS